MRVAVILATLTLWASAAASETLHLCPIVGPFGASVEMSGPSPWTVMMPRGEMQMFTSGSSLFCKYQGITLTKEVDSVNCVLGSEGGSITAPPRSPESTVCTFRGEISRGPRDCFIICM